MAVNLLVVDDEPLIRNLVAAHFRALGYDVMVAGDGDDALCAMSARRTDILITDLQMPGLDGLGLLARLRNEYPLTRAVVLTSYVTLDNVFAALKEGAFSVVAKPIDDMAPLERAVDLAYQVLRGWLDQLSTLQRNRTPLHNRVI